MRKRLLPIQSLQSPIHGMISLVSKHRLFDEVLISIGVYHLGTVSRNLQSKRTFTLPLLPFLASATGLPSAVQSSPNDVPVLQQSQLVYRRLHARFIETCQTMSRRNRSVRRDRSSLANGPRLDIHFVPSACGDDEQCDGVSCRGKGTFLCSV